MSVKSHIVEQGKIFCRSVTNLFFSDTDELSNSS